MSRLVVSEVVRHAGVPTRITVIEKWVAVADICRVFHNYNGVLQVCSAFQNSSVFRLKKTWEKVSKNVRTYGLIFTQVYVVKFVVFISININSLNVAYKASFN